MIQERRIGGLSLSLSMFVILAILCCLPCAAAEAGTHETLRVGYMDYDGFIEEQSDGTYIGYGAEYLSRIGAYTGFQYEYIYGEWSELLEKLANREIDLLCTAQYTDERAKSYDYSAYPIGYTQGLLYAAANSELCYEDFQMFNGLSVGIIRNSAIIDLFKDYEKLHGFSCTVVEYDSEEAMSSALASGEVDAICSEHLARHTGLSLLAQIGADAYYLISYRNGPYMEQIDFALRQIKADVDFETDLYHKYYDNSAAATTLVFTASEKQYIADSRPIVVGLDKARAPFSMYDEATQTFRGICRDVLDEISSKSGLTFQCVPMEHGVKTVDLLASGKYDIICGIERDNFITNDDITSTEAFLTSSIVPVGKAGRNLNIQSDLTAAIPAAFQGLQKKLETDYPNLNIMYFNTNRECLDAVVSGDVDIFIQNTHLLSLLLQEPKYENLDILPVEIMTEHTAMAMSSAVNPMLVSIINKSIGNIDDGTISSSLIEHTFASPYKYTTGDMLYKFWPQITIISVLLLSCFALLIAVAVLRRHNELKLQKQNTLLADAVAQADRANVAKGQFLSRMSHEIRTPMNAIVGLTALARQHEDAPAKIDDYLEKIDTSSKVLLGIINDVLDMSAIESNKLKISTAEFDMKQVLIGISTIYYPQCQNKGVKFRMETDFENEILKGDSLRVNQILLNLVSNAYKFTDAGGQITVGVTETAHRDNTAFLRFTVSDTGCGMSEEMKSRLFQPFEQESPDTAKRHGGSGLGLSITKNLVTMMHGAIQVESEQGKGTRFIVDIPFETVGQGPRISAEELGALRVLTVDDDPAALEYTSIVLRRIGVKFDTANSGQEALDMIHAADIADRPYDVCLVDWKMSGMDGVELTHRIRATETERSLIIIVSAYDLNTVTDSASLAGADHFISKPLFQSTLFNVLMTLTNELPKTEDVDSKEYDFTGHRVLLAEDQELNTMIAIELLELVKMSVDHAENGQVAVDKFTAAAPGTYDLILMDVQMPVMDGYEATRVIRNVDRPDAKTIPIFAMTANAFSEDVATAISTGMNGHIAKPIDTDIFYKTISDVIHQAK